MTTTHPQCGATWSGLRVEHCTACHLTFSGTRAGDAHERYEDGKRRCLPVPELRARTKKNGDPFFAVRVNEYGTEVWGQFDSRPHPQLLARNADAPAVPPESDDLGTGFRAVSDAVPA